ncbi:8108_t:CDS:2 [Scutellospora calospora]|uniref:8108_t:CDS:1 n=1 Tax=Scutellospora calospora TaxID=85575 RepID=A0ACA9K1G1_9GLOM|nr:8108_t:CDS:2 [Scutellospora calospora]
MLKRLPNHTNYQKILDCFTVADAIKNTAIEAKKTLNAQPKVSVILPTNSAGKARIDSANYVAKKRKIFEQLNIPMQLIKISPQYNETQIKELIKELGNDHNNTGIILQLPFPLGFSVNQNNLLNTIPTHKDIDGLTTGSMGNLFDLEKGLKPATPLGICSIFDYYNISTEGKHIVIMGKGQLVGRPLACMLMNHPASCSDDFVKPGAIVIDAGINRIPSNFINGNSKIVGDVDHSTYEICKHYTPVPSGVGLLTVSSLAFNAVNASILQSGLPPLNLSQIIRQKYSNEKVEKISIASSKKYSDKAIEKSKKKLNFLLLSSAYNDDAMRSAFAQHKPDLIICPTLMKAIPEDIYTKVKCLMVHPGIKGDRGPSSLDWAIINKKDEADKEMDAGPIWASENFFVPKIITKTHLYNSHVINTAARLVLECIKKFQLNDFKPELLNYSNASVKGKLHETIRQSHSLRQINWEMDTTEFILRKIRAADSQPGVKAEIDLNGQKITRFLYDCHNEKTKI